MVKHNNVVPNQHFRKDWQRFVKTWFNQPARHKRRKAHRVAKAKRLAPRPVGKLRPLIRPQHAKYNHKLRRGRGFTLEELKAVNIHPKKARCIGIAVDPRRHNHSVESLNLNVKRLKSYLKKLVLFPKNKAAWKGLSEEEKNKLRNLQQPDRTQWNPRYGLPFKRFKKLDEPRVIRAQEFKLDVMHAQKTERYLAKNWGRDRKKKIEADEKAKLAMKKKKK